MKAKARIIVAITTLLGWAPAAWAAAGGREDNSQLVVWAFLIFCALIVVAQVFPAIRGARRAAIEDRGRTTIENLSKVSVKD